MTIIVNGSAREVPAGTTLGQLIEQTLGTRRGSAIVVDGEIVARSDWDRRTVEAGHAVEVITAVQGG